MMHGHQRSLYTTWYPGFILSYYVITISYHMHDMRYTSQRLEGRGTPQENTNIICGAMHTGLIPVITIIFFEGLFFLTDACSVCSSPPKDAADRLMQRDWHYQNATGYWYTGIIYCTTALLYPLVFCTWYLLLRATASFYISYVILLDFN